MSDIWEKAQKFEIEWWGDCLNTYGEEEKQLVYAGRMGLKRSPKPGTPYNFDVMGRKILDVGGGVCSLLNKCTGVEVGSLVVDPILKKAPQWVRDRYISVGIIPLGMKAEDIDTGELVTFDEVWIYNVLQHTEDPALICKNARKLGKIVRIFEWVDTETNEGHPHTLTEKSLNEWLGGEGKTEVLNQNTLRGKCYYGIFKGDSYGN